MAIIHTFYRIYKGKHIIYSIGNFILPQTYYGKKKLLYKDVFIQNELVVEWDGSKVTLHNLYYDVSNNTVRLLEHFPQDALYERFAPTSMSLSMPQRQYIHQFLHELPLRDVIFHTRLYPTRVEELKSYLLRRIFRLIRKIIIAIGLHHPYR